MCASRAVREALLSAKSGTYPKTPRLAAGSLLMPSRLSSTTTTTEDDDDTKVGEARMFCEQMLPRVECSRVQKHFGIHPMDRSGCVVLVYRYAA